MESNENQEAEQTVSDDTLPPAPAHTEPIEPTETVTPPPVEEHVDVPCAGCGQSYGFDIKPNTATFTFMCRKCGTRSEWVRQE